MKDQSQKIVQNLVTVGDITHLPARFLLPLGFMLLVTVACSWARPASTGDGRWPTESIQQGITDLYQDGVDYQARMLGAVMETISRNEALRDARLPGIATS